ncbi:hypothetical protein ABZX90_42835 [Streptomyces sp. NPDC002935]|uniref:hypothetical protein n=1 Tax=Streptomyces sp. NPDC002935 TaxID=3154545 RepID=UPI0033B8ED69
MLVADVVRVERPPGRGLRLGLRLRRREVRRREYAAGQYIAVAVLEPHLFAAVPDALGPARLPAQDDPPAGTAGTVPAVRPGRAGRGRRGSAAGLGGGPEVYRPEVRGKRRGR